MPYTETSFSQAIFQMFENLDTYLEKNYDDLPQEAVKVYLYYLEARGLCDRDLENSIGNSEQIIIC